MDLFAAQELSVWTRTQNRKAGNGVNDNTYFPCARASWRQHNAPPPPPLRRVGLLPVGQVCGESDLEERPDLSLKPWFPW